MRRICYRRTPASESVRRENPCLERAPRAVVIVGSDRSAAEIGDTQWAVGPRPLSVDARPSPLAGERRSERVRCIRTLTDVLGSKRPVRASMTSRYRAVRRPFETVPARRSHRSATRAGAGARRRREHRGEKRVRGAPAGLGRRDGDESGPETAPSHGRREFERRELVASHVRRSRSERIPDRRRLAFSRLGRVPASRERRARRTRDR